MRKCLICFIIIITVISFNKNLCALVLGECSKEQEKIDDLEKIILDIIYTEDVITPTHAPKSLSETAENIIVITSKQIERMNAHTVIDVLNNIPGIQRPHSGGPGSTGNIHIQGSYDKHVLFVIDRVVLNHLSNQTVDVGSIPVKNIKRIEIIKGPASSSWGSSLGGIVNIITKSTEDFSSEGGELSASYGDRNTMDHNAEAYGKIRDLEYYFFASNLDSKGFVPNTSVSANNFYTKLGRRWGDTNHESHLLFTLGHNQGANGMGEGEELLPEAYHWNSEGDSRFSFFTLSFDRQLDKDVTMSLAVWRSYYNYTLFTLTQYTDPNQVTCLESVNEKNRKDAGSAQLVWNQGMQTLVFGANFDSGILDINSDNSKIAVNRLNKWAILANDTILLNKVSFTPGIRYDHTNTYGDFLSPSFGLTFKIPKDTIIRCFMARGFNIPRLSDTYGNTQGYLPNPDLKVEKVVSFQIGIESRAFKYFWCQATLFRHDIKDAIENKTINENNISQNISVNIKQRRQGAEIELKTIPLYKTNTLIFAGFTYTDAKDRNTKERLVDIARYTYDIGLQYHNKASAIMASLTGHYIYWYPDPMWTSIYQSQFHTFLWDLNIVKRICNNDDKRTIEAFLTAHNIFNGSQWLMYSFRTPRRWLETGVRFRF